MVRFVYGFLPAIVKYVDDLPAEFAGQAKRIVVKILSRCRDDYGLLHHELTHVKQFYRTFMFHGVLYKFVKRYRLAAEIEAYKVQLKINAEDDKPDYTNFYARRITEIYDLDISFVEAKELLEA
jgi:hypothetical protein